MGQFRPIAIALILQDDYGNMRIFGSRSLKNATIEGSRDVTGSPFVGGVDYKLTSLEYSIRADCYSMVQQVAYPAAPAPAEQRGIYLPDMSFRALPPPEVNHD